MNEFENAKIIRKANIYFDGKVTSRTVILSDNSKVTLGIMLPGDYEFNTANREIMEIISGELEALLPDTDKWQTFKDRSEFEVKANASFKLKVKKVTDYCCSYL